MATTQPTDFSPSNFKGNRATIDNYVSLGDYIEFVNKVDNRDKLVRTYGDQSVSGLNGLLELVGAVRQEATHDYVQWWEETRLHAAISATADGAIATTDTGAKSFDIVAADAKHNVIKVGDVLLLEGYVRAYVTAVSGLVITALPYKATWGITKADGAAVKMALIGNEFKQGSDQPGDFVGSNVVKHENTFSIIKSIFAVTGSQMTNIAWVQDPESGKPMWYLKQEADVRQRFADYQEMMLVLGEKAANTTLSGSTHDINGAEGLFSAVENRGIVHGGYVDQLSEIDDIIKALDKQGGAMEYAVYGNRTQMLNLDDLIAAANNGAGANGSSFGVFNNDANMAVTLGFKSFNRGGYTFHNKSWKLLNEPTLLGVAGADHYKFIMIPMDSVVDAKTGIAAPSLEKNYKAADGYSREMEHWLTGGARGVYNDTVDRLQMNYRSECNLITRAANRFVLGKGA